MNDDDFAERTNDHLAENIRSADTKASILLTAQLTFLGLFGNGVAGLWSGAGCLLKLAAGLTGLFGFFGAILSIGTIFPRNVDDGADDGLMNAGRIDDLDSQVYVEEVENLQGEDDVVEQVLFVNHSLAGIASTKFDWIRCSLIATVLMLAAGSLTAGIYVLG